MEKSAEVEFLNELKGSCSKDMKDKTEAKIDELKSELEKQIKVLRTNCATNIAELNDSETEMELVYKFARFVKEQDL